MLITNDTKKFDVSKIEGPIIFDASITKEPLLEALHTIYKYEKENKMSFELHLKEINFELKKEVILDFISDETNCNVGLVLSTFNLIKGFNTFDDGFFEHPQVIFNNIEEFLDAKIYMNRELQYLIKQLTFYYLSIIRSCGIVYEGTVDDTTLVYVPTLYSLMLNIGDFITLANVFEKAPDMSFEDLARIENARDYVLTWANKFTMSLNLSEILFKELEVEDSLN